MKRPDNDNIERLFENLCVTTSKEMDRRVLDDAFAALEVSKHRKSPGIVLCTRIAKFAVAAVIVIAILLGVIILRDLDKKRSREIVKQTGVSSIQEVGEIPEKKKGAVDATLRGELAAEKLKVELEKIEQMFAAKDIDGLLAMLTEGHLDLESKVAAANYLAKIGDFKVMAALETLSDQWKGKQDENPFIKAIETIKERLSQKGSEEKEGVREKGSKIDQPDTEDIFVLRVVSKETNEPMEKVQLYIQIDKEKSENTTDTGGQCKITIGEANYLAITAKKDGFVPMTLSYRKNENITSIPNSYILALEKGSSISGFVKNEEEEPIEGANVSFMIFGSSKTESVALRDHIVRTDSEGYWQCDIVPAKTDSIRIEVSHPDYMSVTIDIGSIKRLMWYGAGADQPQIHTMSVKSLLSMTGVVTMKRGLTVTGIVLDPNGKPIKDASVIQGPSMYNNATRTKTDADGRFSFTQVPPENIILTAQANGYAPDLKEISFHKDMPLVEFRLESGHTIRGRVVDSENRPIKDADVGTNSWRGYMTIQMGIKTDSQGYFEFNDAPKDKVLFSISKEDYMSINFYPMSPAEDEYVIILYKHLQISGKVIDADSNKPVNNFQLIPGIKFESSDLVYWLRDDAINFTNGRYKYTFKNKYDGYYIRIEADGYVPGVSPELYDKENAVFDFALLKGTGSIGTVYLPDGEPAIGAEVIIYTASRQGNIQGGKNIDKGGSVFVVSGNDGRFSLPPQVEEYLLVVLHDKGYAEITDKKLATDPNILLTPWGRLEGILHIGRKPAVNEKIWWYRNKNMSRQEIIPVWHGCDTMTDANGHFVFEKLPPEKVTVHHVIESGRFRSGRGSSKTLEIMPGQTAKITLGGSGRPVTGRLVVPTDYKGKIDFNFGDNTLDLILPEYPHPKNLDLLTGKEKDTWQRIWQKSDRRTVYTEAHQEYGRSYGVKIEDDGTFRIEDVIPGNYILRLRLYERPKDKPYGLGDYIGSVNYEFEIPDMNEVYSDAPLDIGVVELELKKSLQVGDSAPLFEIESLNGELINLKDYNGKIVLINFWMSMHPKCVEETLKLKEVFEKFRSTERFVMIGLSLDYDIEDAEKFIKDNGLIWSNCFLNAMPDETVAKDYGLDSLPYTILIGPNGKVIAKNPGAEQLELVLNKVLRK